ncbi:MAG TPA: tRNA (adenosine(37)-N6)-dimethylallyltransferase MiaA [Gemmatimonadaceae bacterium]|nr:tRNA (adenosine(37)-N6)-dimethylallyltransferase MiaA [Gemmatimonadaceae bacterium]
MSSSDASDGSSVRVICGPTAAGKSAIAMALAQLHGAVIISADSRQIYRGFDIGTAKPSVADQRLVPHRGIDVVEPLERYSAARWAKGVQGWITEARGLGREPLVVGGTGFYLRALVEPLFESPPLDPERRAALERLFATTSTDDLRRWCLRLDPERAHLGRVQLARSVETALLTGERLSDLHRSRAQAPTIRARYLVVDPGATLAARIEARYDAMMAAGWADEVRSLTGVVDPSAPAWKASGYRVVRDLVENRVSERAAREQVIIETRQYAKRQRTWFRHQLPAESVTRVSPDDRNAGTIVSAWWEGRTAE